VDVEFVFRVGVGVVAMAIAKTMSFAMVADVFLMDDPEDKKELVH
jgi:hypothetical protein